MIQKYRAWDKLKEALYIVEDINYLTETIGVEEYDYIFSFDDIIIMQSTGLFDKNGNEIFEGDIVLFEDSCGNDEFSFFKTGVVEITQCRLNITNRYSVEIDDLLDDNHLDITVIGNLHQHPELLEELE